ncbi:MAG TPA: pyrroline-5-carboxylate reductase [Candidatus Latescibacteria bacterium]|nr:pyrroline-5-carboxylate reductase [Candidatus Latescibacterota bacterium]
MITDKQVMILGAGNMGSCLLGGICRAKLVPPDHIIITGLRKDYLESLADQWGVHWTTDNKKAVEQADVIMLCLKPQAIGRVLTEIKGYLNPNQLIITIAAGVTTSYISAQIDSVNPVVRVMPNIASLVDEGAAAISVGDHGDDHHLEITAQIFRAVGRVVFVREDLLDAVTGLSGSGPAYIYMVIEALSDGGVKMGLPREIALDLAAQTVLGAARLIQETGIHPAVLRDQVLTPGGTTIAAVHDLETSGLRSMLISAVETATRRSKELSSQA